MLRGEEPLRQHLSKDELIQQSKALKSPAARTEMSWKSALDVFLEHAGVTHPTAATKQHIPSRIQVNSFIDIDMNG